ncbi:hypothetical protein [Vibrio pelagius]|uniref:hypothetical protein n=1 Tax=Vibrio pelagius TaxID=28169 RepID=UPI0021C47E8D|nr:hypothetical protein [Vibrio pelagius]
MYMHMLKEIAKQIVNKDADYLLSVKGNQEKLDQTISKTFNSSMINDYDGDKYCIQDRGHGRTETGLALLCHDTSLLGDIAYD